MVTGAQGSQELLANLWKVGQEPDITNNWDMVSYQTYRAQLLAAAILGTWAENLVIYIGNLGVIECPAGRGQKYYGLPGVGRSTKVDL